MGQSDFCDLLSTIDVLIKRTSCRFIGCCSKAAGFSLAAGAGIGLPVTSLTAALAAPFSAGFGALGATDQRPPATTIPFAVGCMN